MIDHLVLHLGHAKTGTTSLQATFRDSADILAEHGLYYFAGHRAHHPVSRYFGGDRGPARDKQRVARMMREMRRSQQPLGLISSEALTRLDDAQARACVAAFGEVARRVSVLLYVRHPVAFASSAAHQGVRMGRPLARSIREPRVLPIRDLVRRWRAAAGEDAVSVRPFARDRLVNGDVIDDMLHVLGIAGAAPHLRRRRVNEGLSLLGVHLLDAARRAMPDTAVTPAMLRPFDAIGGPKYVLPRQAQETVRRQAAPELAFLKEAFGIDLPEPRDAPSGPPPLDEETLQAVGTILLRQGQHLAEVERTRAGRLLGLRSPFDRAGEGATPAHPLLRRSGLASLLAGRAADVSDLAQVISGREAS